MFFIEGLLKFFFKRIHHNKGEAVLHPQDDWTRRLQQGKVSRTATKNTNHFKLKLFCSDSGCADKSALTIDTKLWKSAFGLPWERADWPAYQVTSERDPLTIASPLLKTCWLSLHLETFQTKKMAISKNRNQQVNRMAVHRYKVLHLNI